jgi:hypothetical protein
MEADVSLAQKSSTWGGAIELAVCRSARLLHRAAVSPSPGVCRGHVR